MKNKLAFLLLTFICITCTVVVKAQTEDPPPPDSGVPIDGGASLLVGAAVVYGVKKYKDRKKEQQPIK
jgi:hypothetical protein